MGTQQLAALFLCNIVLFTTGSALVGLLPVYALRLGADAALTGVFLAFAFFALAVSTVIAGRLADRFQKRKALLITAGVLAMPATALLTATTTVEQLTLLVAVIWFAGGIGLTMVNILVGLFAEPGQRGRVFGIIGLAGPVGALIGGFGSGPIVDRWGFPALFTVVALLYALIPLIGLFVQDKAAVPRPDAAAVRMAGGVFSNRTFLFLFCATAVGHIANSGLILIRPLIMDAYEFDATAISSTGAMGGLLGLPLPLLIGWLSDRLGRKPLLILCFLSTSAGLLVLAYALDLWHFWVAAALQTVISSTLVVGSALITDSFPRASLAAPLSIFGATPWIGFVIGFGGGGAAVNAFQSAPTLLFGALLSLAAILLVLPVKGHEAKVPVVESLA